MTVPTRRARRLQRITLCTVCGGTALGELCATCREQQRSAQDAATDAVLQAVVFGLADVQPWAAPGAAVWAVPRTRAECVRLICHVVALARGMG